MPPNPNRFAQGLEATTLRDRISDEELALDVLRAKYERAERASHEAQAKFREIEEQYHLHKALVKDTSAYLSTSKVNYDNQLKSLETHRAFFHPVRRTPLDILGYIFELCYDELKSNAALSVEKADIRTRQRQSFRLATVCRRWRDASLATPRAWAYLELSFDHAKSGNCSTWITYVQTVTSRARSVPLDVCLTRKRESKAHHQQLAAVVAAALRNCVAIQLHISNLLTADTLLAVLTAHTPRLVQALVELPLVPATVLAGTQVFPGAPALKNLCSTQAFDTGNTFVYPALEDARLNYVTSTDSEQDVLKQLFNSAPSLAKLWLHFPTFTHRPAFSVPQLAVSQLTVLTMELGDDCTLVEGLFSRYRFPALSSLTLWGNMTSANARLDALRLVLSTSPLTEFIISDIDRERFAVLLDILAPHTKLAMLRVEISAIVQADLAAFCDALRPRNGSSTWPCKSLASVDLMSVAPLDADCDPATALSLIKDRASASERLPEGESDRPCRFEDFRVGIWNDKTDLQKQINAVLSDDAV